jgi:hypothetical protein
LKRISIANYIAQQTAAKNFVVVSIIVVAVVVDVVFFSVSVSVSVSVVFRHRDLSVSFNLYIVYHSYKITRNHTNFLKITKQSHQEFNNKRTARKST